MIPKSKRPTTHAAKNNEAPNDNTAPHIEYNAVVVEEAELADPEPEPELEPEPLEPEPEPLEAGMPVPVGTGTPVFVIFAEPVGVDVDGGPKITYTS